MYIVKRMIGGSNGKLFPVNKNGNCIDGIEEEIVKFKTFEEAEKFGEELDTYRFVIIKWKDRSLGAKIKSKIVGNEYVAFPIMLVLWTIANIIIFSR